MWALLKLRKAISEPRDYHRLLCEGEAALTVSPTGPPLCLAVTPQVGLAVGHVEVKVMCDMAIAVRDRRAKKTIDIAQQC